MVTVAKHPLTVPTSTLYVPASPGVANGIVKTSVVVDKATPPFFQVYVVPPFAVKTIVPPTQISPLFSTVAFGKSFTITVVVAMAVHPLSFVTNT